MATKKKLLTEQELLAMSEDDYMNDRQLAFFRHRLEEMEKELRSQFKYLDYARIIFISAKTHQRVNQLFPLIQEAYLNSHKRVQTSVLNDVLVDAQAINPTTTFNGGRLKIFYANQVSICPPTFVLFVNDPQYMHFSYKRYLENRLRESFGFEGTPIHIICRKRD